MRANDDRHSLAPVRIMSPAILIRVSRSRGLAVVEDGGVPLCTLCCAACARAVLPATREQRGPCFAGMHGGMLCASI